jgi:hypothetical protein
MAETCLRRQKATSIVLENCPNGPQDIDHTLEEIGLVTLNQRLVFRESLCNRS